MLSVVAGLAGFATFSLANWGTVAIIPSYFMIAFPAWTEFVYQAAESIRLLVYSHLVRSFRLWYIAVLFIYLLRIFWQSALRISAQAEVSTG